MALKVTATPIDINAYLQEFDKQARLFVGQVGQDMVDDLNDQMKDVLGIFPDAEVVSDVKVNDIANATVRYDVQGSQEFDFVQGGTKGSSRRRSPVKIEIREPRTKPVSLQVKPRQPVTAEVWLSRTATVAGIQPRGWYGLAFRRLRKKFDNQEHKGAKFTIANHRVNK